MRDRRTVPDSKTILRGLIIYSQLEAITYGARGPLLAPPIGCRTAHSFLMTELLGALFEKRSASALSSDSLDEPLTSSETRVLRYLPTNLSKPEIARELHVSVDTVKTHVKHLYAKLDAHSRREAVQRARELRLLPNRSQ